MKRSMPIAQVRAIGMECWRLVGTLHDGSSCLAALGEAAAGVGGAAGSRGRGRRVLTPGQSGGADTSFVVRLIRHCHSPFHSTCNAIIS